MGPDASGFHNAEISLKGSFFRFESCQLDKDGLSQRQRLWPRCTEAYFSDDVTVLTKALQAYLITRATSPRSGDQVRRTISARRLTSSQFRF
jgi:hypothetical protein